MQVDYDFLAREYARHRQVMPEVLYNLLEIAGINEASQVLDVGCGTGNYTLALENALGCLCWGVDPSRQMLASARERTYRAHFQICRAEQLDFPNGFFDLVFSVDVIHHLSDPPAFFSEAYRVLKEGGLVCTVTDSEQIIRRRQPLSVYFPETVEIELQRYPPIADLGRMMHGSGFDHFQEILVEHAYELTDIGPYRNKAFSSLHLISAEAFERGIQRMQRDLQEHPIPAVSRYVLLWGMKPVGGKITP